LVRKRAAGYLCFRPQQCLINRHTGYDCAACADSCPTGAISLKHGINIATDKCTGCGVCVNTCPTEVFHLADVSYEQWLNDALKKTKDQSKLRIVCERATSTATDLVVPCIGWLNECLLVALGILHPAGYLEIDTSPCRTCRQNKNVKIVKKNIQCARQILKGVRKPFKIRLCDKSNTPTIPRVRRQFKGFARKLKGKLQILRQDDRQSVVEKRDILARALSETKIVSRVSLSWHNYGNIKLLSEYCNGCGFCARICPTHALNLITAKKEVSLQFDVYRCINCGLCTELCPEEVIKLRAGNTGQFRHASPKTLARFRMANCIYCDRSITVPINCEAVCPTCARHRELAEGYLI